MNEEDVRAAIVGEPALHEGAIELAAYDPSWPDRSAREAERIRTALGEESLTVEHVGSTSVAGLAAKPVIDILLVVTDSANEAAYVGASEAAGYVLRIREPDWHEHRMLVRNVPKVHIHVFSKDCPEIERLLAFRNRLREHDDERELYERTKRELARRRWTHVQDYADAKAAVVEEIISRGSEPGSAGP